MDFLAILWHSFIQQKWVPTENIVQLDCLDIANTSAKSNRILAELSETPPEILIALCFPMRNNYSSLFEQLYSVLDDTFITLGNSCLEEVYKLKITAQPQ